MLRRGYRLIAIQQALRRTGRQFAVRRCSLAKMVDSTSGSSFKTDVVFEERTDDGSINDAKAQSTELTITQVEEFDETLVKDWIPVDRMSKIVIWRVQENCNVKMKFKNQNLMIEGLEEEVIKAKKLLQEIYFENAVTFEAKEKVPLLVGNNEEVLNDIMAVTEAFCYPRSTNPSQIRICGTQEQVQNALTAIQGVVKSAIEFDVGDQIDTVVGPKHSNLKNIRAETGALVQPDFKAGVIRIAGAPEQIRMATDEILYLMEVAPVVGKDINTMGPGAVTVFLNKSDDVSEILTLVQYHHRKFDEKNAATALKRFAQLWRAMPIGKRNQAPRDDRFAVLLWSVERNIPFYNDVGLMIIVHSLGIMGMGKPPVSYDSFNELWVRLLERFCEEMVEGAEIDLVQKVLWGLIRANPPIHYVHFLNKLTQRLYSSMEDCNFQDLSNTTIMLANNNLPETLHHLHRHPWFTDKKRSIATYLSDPEVIGRLARGTAQSSSNIIVGLTRLFASPLQEGKYAALRENIIKTVINLCEHQLQQEPNTLSITNTISCLSTLGLQREELFSTLASHLPLLEELPGDKEIGEIFIACAIQGFYDQKLFDYLLKQLSRRPEAPAQTFAETCWALAVVGRHKEPKLQKLASVAKVMRKTFVAALEHPTDFSVEDGAMLLQTDIALKVHKELHEKFPRLASPMVEMFVHGHDRGGKKQPKLKKLFTNVARSLGLKIVPDFKTNEGLLIDLAGKSASGKNVAIQFLDRSCFFLDNGEMKRTIQFQLELLEGSGWKVLPVKSFEDSASENFREELRELLSQEGD